MHVWPNSLTHTFDSFAKPKRILTHKTAANKNLDLEALKRFNDLRLEYSLKIQAARQRAINAHPRAKAKMRSKIPKLRPTTDASDKVAFAYAKGPSFARRLRKTAEFLCETGALPESNQGKGAFHASALNNPDIISGLRHWATDICSDAEESQNGDSPG
ncbi:hypothetical protein B0H14DRAFT_3470808 [Mycena olivaceomarginata]|nr:hypothetical protein B0H14DRAFT_3470808 [Mycena olivaceomarginata]